MNKLLPKTKNVFVIFCLTASKTIPRFREAHWT